MYTAYFGFKESPFTITPNPRYLYLSPPHQEALALLLYGTQESGGFVQLTGEVGTGKTTLIRTLIGQHNQHVDVALCLNPKLTVVELVAAVCDELHVDYPRTDCTLKSLTDALTIKLLKAHSQGRRTVLIIDEAQNLNRDVLEQIRLLTNLETHQHKLLHIVLVGQPELRRLLARRDMRQLTQRITARYHLTPLDYRSSRGYILHRLRVAGNKRKDIFTESALRLIHYFAGGTPRLINVICDRALLGAYSQNLPRVNGWLVYQAAKEVLKGPSWTQKRYRRRALFSLMGMIAIGFVMVKIYHFPSEQAADFPATIPAPAASTLQQSARSPSPDAETSMALSSLVDFQGTESAPLQPATAWGPSPQTQPMSISSMTVSDREAMAQLLAIWGEKALIPLDVSPCDYVPQHNLRCLAEQGDWDELRRYNLPAILTLQSSTQKGHVVLRALEGDTATLDRLDGDEDPFQVGIEKINPLWNGNFLLLWRLQTALPFIGPGMVGEPVIWLRQRLALAEGRAVAAHSLSRVFDTVLKERVENFQRANDLRADGLVGQRTMPLLNNLAPEPGTPLLDLSKLDGVN
jgi:general secretion pathway protein A